MKKSQVIRSFRFASLALMFTLAACDGVTDPDAGGETGSVRGQTADATGQARFDVEVRYAGGNTRDQAVALLQRIEIAPVDGTPLPQAAIDADSTEVLDASEPTFRVILHPLNPLAASKRYAWQAPLDVAASAATDGPPAADGTQPTDGTDTRTSALKVSFDLDHRWLDHGQTWSTGRYSCHSFTFGVVVPLGAVQPCILQGAEGKAGTFCGLPNTFSESIGDANPFNTHYFRGRATGVGTGGELASAYIACI